MIVNCGPRWGYEWELQVLQLIRKKHRYTEFNVFVLYRLQSLIPVGYCPLIQKTTICKISVFAEKPQKCSVDYETSSDVHI